MSPFDQDQARTALWMGCSVEAMNLTHDSTHVALMAAIGVPSQSMRVAAGEGLSDVELEIAKLEEAAVLHVQRLMFALGRERPK